jgi:hypothetical protein
MNTPYPPRTVIAKAGYRRERWPGGILVMRLLDNQTETIDAWFEDCQLNMSAWRVGRRLRYLHDIRSAEHITAYSTERVTRVLRVMRHTEVSDAKGAVLLKTEAIGTLLSSFLRRRAYEPWQIQFFTDELAALGWLSN